MLYNENCFYTYLNAFIGKRWDLFFISRLFLAQQLDQGMALLRGCQACCLCTPRYFPPGLTTQGLMACTGDFQSVVQRLSHGKTQTSLLEAKDFLLVDILAVNNPVQLQQHFEQDMTSQATENIRETRKHVHILRI